METKKMSPQGFRISDIAIFVETFCPHYVVFTRPHTHKFRSLYPPYFAMWKYAVFCDTGSLARSSYKWPCPLMLKMRWKTREIIVYNFHSKPKSTYYYITGCVNDWKESSGRNGGGLIQRCLLPQPGEVLWSARSVLPSMHCSLRLASINIKECVFFLTNQHTSNHHER